MSLKARQSLQVAASHRELDFGVVSIRFRNSET